METIRVRLDLVEKMKTLKWIVELRNSCRISNLAVICNTSKIQIEK